jgi:cysteine-rich repeat protein
MSNYGQFPVVRFLFLFLTIFSMALFVQAEDEVKDPNPPEDTGPGVSIDAVGGPDGFGYSSIDSNEPGGPVYDFIDISGSGTDAGISCDDCGSVPVNISFPFNFYGTVNTQVVMSSNGYMAFGDPAETGQDLSNDCPVPAIPSSPLGTPGARLYVLHDDLVVLGAGYYQTFANCPNTSGGSGACTIYQWENAEHYPASDAFDFQAILYDNGNILTQYAPGNPEMGSGSTTGLQNYGPTPTIGLTYACNSASTITDNLAVCYIHPDSPKQDCIPETGGLEIASVNYGVCVFTKSTRNRVNITGVTPNNKVAMIMGAPGSTIISGPTCNGLEVDVRQMRIFGVFTADSNGEVSVAAPVPQSGNLGQAIFQIVDLATCTKNEAEAYSLVSNRLPPVDLDNDGVVNCDDECPREGPPGPGEFLDGDGCIATEECGNGIVDPGEVCDDGNDVEGDGCNFDCSIVEPGFICPIPGVPCSQCGNEVVEPGEECDDGNIVSGDGCSADCSFELEF